MGEPSWELYRPLLAVLREGSLSGAARVLGTTQPTVGRQMEALEGVLGTALFTRGPGGMVPTDAALRLRPHLDALEATAASLWRTARESGTAIDGVVRVTASEVMGAEWLPPILARLRDAHPGLIVELVLSNRVEDLLRRDADIAVRMTPPAQGALRARKVGAVEVGLHARADYLARAGVPRTVAALQGHALIGVDRGSAFTRAASAALGFDAGWTTLRTDSDLAQLAAIRAGYGIGFCQVGIARREGLVRVLAGLIEVTLGVWVVMHEDLAGSLRCRAVFDALVGGRPGALPLDPVGAAGPKPH